MKKSKADYKMLWALISLILFAGIIVSASLLQHSESKSSFSVNIVSPTGGETWQGNTEHTIAYTISNGVPNYTVELYYTANGVAFYPINETEINVTEGEYNWTTPNITSNTVRIRINVTDQNGDTATNLSEPFEIDSTPPNAVTDLSAQSISSDTITLTWTAPSEDGAVGRINITQDEIPDLIIPDNSETGITSNLTVGDNLIIYKTRVYLRINHTCLGDLIVKLSHPDGTTITLFNKTGGSSSNLWGWYEDGNFSWEGSGNIVPQPVPNASLSAFNYKGSQGVWKLWVADTVAQVWGVIDYWVLQLFAQPVSSYKIRYNTSAEVTEANWNDSMPYMSTPLPALPGTTQNITITGLEAGVKYYFGLRSEDNAGWESEVSNSPNGTTRLYVQVLSPNGDVVWSGKSLHTIRYKFSGAKPPSAPESEYTARIYYIYETGTVLFTNQSWLNLTEECTCDWNTPYINSTNVKILVNVTTRANYSYGEDESNSNFTIDSSSPKVLSATPANNTYVLHDENIIITFNESMNKTSVENAFSITPTVTNLVWAWNINYTIATVYHDDFTQNQLYNCIINTTAKDISEPGNPLLEDYFFNFTVVEPLNVRVIYPNGNETWDGTKNQTIAYEISGGAPPYNITLYWVNATDGVIGLIGYDTNSSAGEHSWTWVAPSITNNTLKIKISIVDNTTPFQTTYDISDWFFEIDSTAPGKPDPEEPAPNSIAVEGYPRAHAVKLNWIAPGDDEAIGKASYYDIRCYDSYITEENWDDIPSYWRFTYNAVASTGEFDSYVINDLEPDKVYYFRLKAYDNIGFASDLSDCVSIKTLKFETWSDTMEGVPGFEWINNTLHITSSKTVSYTEVLMKGNLRVVNNKELKFEKVLFIMDCSEDWEYSIQVAPGGLAGFLEGGKFELQYSNISASVSTMPDGSERWHPYLFTAYRNSIFWMFYSSMHHCGGKPEDIENIELGFAQIDVELDVELGIEIRSSDVSIENSIISQNWGLFIRTSLPMGASPTIKYNTIEHNRYGMVIKPKIDIAEQWPINLIVNNISNNGVGIYSDSARVGLEGCRFIGNTYGAIYNNTPLDWPNNVSGVIYHCRFEGNTYALTATNSSLELTQTDFLNNTRIYLDSVSVSSHLYYTIYCKNTPMNITNADILSNAYAHWNNSVLTDTSIVTLYCENSALNITNANISDNNGAFYSGTSIIDTRTAASAFSMDTMSTTIYHKNSLVSITNTTMKSNGKPFYSENSNYIIRVIAPNGTVEEEEVTEELPAIFYDQDRSATLLYHLATVYVQSSALEFKNNIFEHNIEGILCVLSPYLVVDGCKMTGDGWHTTMGFISTPRIAYSVISIGAPVTFTNNIVSEYISGIVVSAGEINLTCNTFHHVLLGVVLAGSPNIPTILPAPGILFQNLWNELELMNVNASVAKNTFEYNAVGIIAGYSNLIMDDNSFTGKGWMYMDAYEGAVGVLAASSTIKMNDATMTTLYWAGVLSSEEFALTFGGVALNLSFLQFENVTYGASDITITNSTLEYLFTGGQLSDSTLTVCDSTIDQCFYSLYSESSTISFKNVVIPSGWLYGGNYYGYTECTNSTVTIQDSSISNSAELLFVKSKVSVTNTDFINNTDALKCDDSEVIVSDSYFERNGKGIAVYGEESTLKVSDTIFYRNSYGIYAKGLTSTEGPYIEIGELGRNVFANNVNAIYCELGVAGIIEDNDITSQFRGIYIGETARELEIKNNNIRGGSRGIYIESVTGKLTIVNNIPIRDCSEAGIYSAGSRADIAGNEIFNASTGINLASNSFLNISGNKISSCTNGIYCDKTSTLNATANSIMSAYYGINSLSEKYPLLSGNTIVSCTYGIFNFPSGGIAGNIISMNTYGIALRNSNASIYDSTISNCSYGIYSFKSSPTISNTVVIDSKLDSEYYATKYYDEPSPGGVVVGSPQNVIGAPDNKYAILSDGNYLGVFGFVVEGTGTIEKVEIGCKWHTVDWTDARDYMLLQYSTDSGGTYGATNYTDNTKRDSDFTYYLDITSDRDWTWSDLNNIMIELRHIAPPSKPYIYADSLWLRITSSYGIYFYSCPDPGKPGVAPQLINSTVNTGNATIQDILFLNSRADAVNSSFSNIKFSDAASELRIYFYLTVSIKWQTGEPVENGTVKVYNKYGTVWDECNRTWSGNPNITSGYTDKNGVWKEKLFAEFINYSANRSYQPYTINASIYDLSDNKTLWVNATNSVNVWNTTWYTQRQYALLYNIQHSVTLFDLTKPNVYINSIPFSLTNVRNLSVSGRATDNIGISKVEINTNNGTWVTVTTLKVLNSAYGNYTVEWSGILVLQEGSNYIQARAVDTTGDLLNNTDTAVADTVVLDTIPPALIITSPIPETTNQPTLTIMGETEIGATVTINIASVPVDENGNFGMTFSLSEGVNVFTVVASDPLGNENRIVLSIVVFDNTPPTSGIAYIKSPTNSLTSITGIANDDISGVKKVEISIIRGSDGYYWTGSGWSSTETWLTANGTSTWSYSWTHESDGVYTIKSRAVDNADNTETPSSDMIFTYDKTPPTLKNIKPSNNSETESETITVSGETDGVNVTVNGKYAEVKDGKFSATVKLGTGNNGKNVITIIAKDLAGNTNQTTIIVKRTPGWVPPPVEWIGLLVGIIVIALIAVVFVLYKKKIIKLKAPKEKTETGKVRENVLHKEKMGTGKPKENVGLSFEGGSKLK